MFKDRAAGLATSALRLTTAKVLTLAWAAIGVVALLIENANGPLVVWPGFMTTAAGIYVAFRFTTAIAIVACVIYVPVVLYVLIFGPGQQHYFRNKPSKPGRGEYRPPCTPGCRTRFIGGGTAGIEHADDCWRI